MEEGNGNGKGVVVVSLDIADAFGTLHLAVIREVLRYHEVTQSIYGIIIYARQNIHTYE